MNEPMHPLPVHPIPVTTGPPRRIGGPGAVVCIGVFDGVHLGHRSLFARARTVADDRGLAVVALTFDPHPMAVVRPDADPPALATVNQRVDLLADAGADEVRILTFDHATSALSPRDFALQYLRDDLSARAVVVGSNFRFGHRAAGDVPALRELGRELGFEVVEVSLHPDELRAATWSSSRLRELLADGDVVHAAIGLGRLHRVEGRVIHGDHRGRGLGFPTANVEVVPGTCVPGDGVYAGWLITEPYGDRQWHGAAISVGANTTFGGTDPRVEAHVLDGRDWQFYGSEVAVDFVARIRDMTSFDSADDLVAEIARDVEAARAVLSDRPIGR